MKKELSPVKIGNIGEKYIAKFLRRNGYKIIERNMRNFYSEIDIIAENKEYIVFVEVKTRTSGQILPPRAAVNLQKRNKIILAAEAYLSRIHTEKAIRFDIAEVYLYADKNKVESINYIENAFGGSRKYAAF